MTKRVPSGSGRDGREESGAPGPRFCLCALPWDSQKQSTARLGGQDDPPGSPLCSTALPPGRPHAPNARHGPGLPLVLLTSPCPGHMCPASHWLWKEPLLWRPLLTATAHLVCVTLHAHAVFKQFTCFNQRNPPQLRGISTSSWPYREGA